MKHNTSTISLLVALTSITSLLLAPVTFAAGPYNALARTLPSNTSKGVYNPDTDKIAADTHVQGTVWGVNGSTFIIRLPKDDSGYNALITKDTVIRKNGQIGTKKDIVKGKSVSVTGNLDTSTYTISALSVDIGTTNVSEPEPTPTKTVAPAPAPTTKAQTTKQKITGTLKKGSRGTNVTLLQQKLAALKLLAKDSVTGSYGSQTVKAVQAFQKKHGLEVTGSVGPKTLTLLNQ